MARRQEPRHRPRVSLPTVLARVVEAVEERKGEGLVLLDLRQIATFTDYMLVCSGGSERHVQAIADAVLERLAAGGVEPLHTEGYAEARWILIDYVDFLVHIFTPEARAFYELERLWRDAPELLGGRSVDGGSWDAGSAAPAG